MRDQVVYLDIIEAKELVERISRRCTDFDYEMSKNEKCAMAELLSEIGVKVSDVINVDNLADNYAINAEIVKGDDVENYDRSELKEALFAWSEDGETCYCIQW